MPTNFLILAVPAAFAFVLLFIHAWHVRGKIDAVVFFTSLFLFGLLRGNLVHAITHGRTPYSFELPSSALVIGHTGPVEALGWCIAVYVSWSLAERILSRRGNHADNLFTILFMSGAMIIAVAVMMESAAGRMGWWSWTPPRGLRYSPAFRDIEKGILEWFSLAPDFLAPFLLVFYAKLRRPWLAALGFFFFPIHFGLHHVRRIHLDEHLVKVNHLWHFVMVALLIMLPYFFKLDMKKTPDYMKPASPRDEWFNRFDLIGLAIVILTVASGLIFWASQFELVVFSVPLIAAGLYARWWSEKGCVKGGRRR